MVMTYHIGFSQVTQDNNVPVLGRWVGFDNTSIIPLPIENQGDPRIDISSNGSKKFAINELATGNGLNGLSRDSVQRTTMGLKGQTQLAWSMLHLLDTTAENLDITMRRNWMNVGTSYTANVDFMYSGLLERPTADANGLRTDAVIAWGCQNEFENADNFRLIFLGPSFNSNDQGLETMRVTPWGNVGIGNSFSNTIQPHRRTVVHERTDSAQFRIAWGLHPNPLFGRHADFQVTNNGVLHIKNRANNERRPLVVGFLEEEDDLLRWVCNPAASRPTLI